MAPILREILSSGVVLEVAGADRIQAIGTLTDRLRERIRANKMVLLAELTETPHYRWRISDSRSDVAEICCLPELTRDEVTARYPGATIAPLLPEPVAVAELEAP